MKRSPEAATPRTRSDKLTPRQAEILGFIIGHIEKIGYPPTIAEIGKEFGILSTNGSDDHLRALERKGYIRRKPHTARAIVVLKRVAG